MATFYEDSVEKKEPAVNWSKFFRRAPQREHTFLRKLTPQASAKLLYEYCIGSGKKVSESVHSLYIIADHYAKDLPDEPNLIEDFQAVDRIPAFFKALTSREKADFCYNRVVSVLSSEAYPVTVESLRATKRRHEDDPWSSYAGAFVQRVTRTAFGVLFGVALAYFLAYLAHVNWLWFSDGKLLLIAEYFHWFVLGFIGALLHLLNHALTTTREQTFEISEERKIKPRILLGGMLGVTLPWVFRETELVTDPSLAVSSVVALLSGYSVRFSVAFIERLLAALFPESTPKPKP